MSKRFSVGQATHEGVIAYLHGHDGAVRCLAVTPDGARLASGAEDETVRVWDVPTRRELHRLPHEGEVYAVALSADGRRLVSGGGDCVVRFWDLASGKPLRVVDGDSHVVTALALEPSGRRTLAGFDDGSILLIETESGKVQKRLSGATQAVWSVGFSPDGKRAISGDWEGKLRLWNLDTGKQASERETHARNFGGAAFSSDGKQLIYTFDQAIFLASAERDDEPAVLERHQSALYAFALAPGGHHLLTGGGEGSDTSIVLWDLAVGALLHRYQVHDGGNRALALSGDGRLGFSGGYHDRRVAILDLTSRPPLARAEGHPTALLAAAFLPATGQVVTGGMEGALRHFDLESGAERAVLPLPGRFVMPNTVLLSADGRRAVVLDGSTLRAVDLPGGLMRTKIEELPGYPRVGALSPDGQRVALPDENTIRIWTLDGERRKPLLLKGHKESVTCLAFSADGDLLASGSDDETIRLWDGRSGAAKGKPLKGHHGQVTALAFAPGGRLVSGSRDRTLRVWDTATGTALAHLVGHEREVVALAISSDGQRVLSCAEERPAVHAPAASGGEGIGKVRLWDVATGREVARFDPHEGDPFAVAFSPDGKRAYSISRDDRMVETIDLP